MTHVISLLGILLIGSVLSACAPEAIPMEKPSNSAASDLQRPVAENNSQEAFWTQVKNEARKEGKVVVYGPPNSDLRQEYMTSFQRAFPGIALEYLGATGALMAPKLLSERRAGLFLPDVHIGGTTTMLTALKEIMVPIAPLLILDDVKNPARWRENKLEFADENGKFVLVFSAKLGGHATYNTQALSREKMEGFSLRELTQPEWKGKFLFYDPRIAGRGLEFAGWAYPHPALGEDFFKGLAANEVIVGRDARQMQEWVARGKYPLMLAGSPEEGQEFTKIGMPIDFARKFKEGNYLTSAFANVVVLDKAPHPRAAAVFLNWLLGREAQTIWSRVMQYPSLRKDVPVDFLLDTVIPDQGVSYDKGWTEASVRQKSEIQKTMLRIFGAP